MKNYLLIFVTILSSLSFITNAQEYVEPQWKFYFAFEDATGARDTLWNVLDADANWNNLPFDWDTLFGEVPVQLNPNALNVWTYQGNTASYFFKTVARPLLAGPDVEIYANNYVLPITLSWDTALFRAPVLMQNINGPINAPLLDNEYFFNYHASLGWASYCMLYDTQVEMPEFWWGSQNQFPLICTMSRGFGNPLSGSDPLPQKPTLQLYPNPAVDWLRVESKSSWSQYMVLNAQGQEVLQGLQNAVQPGIYVGSLPAGAYILRLLDGKGEKLAAGRFVKQ